MATDPFEVAREYGPGRGPGPVEVKEQELSELLAAQQLGVLASTKRDGRPHLATMSYHWYPDQKLLRITSVAGRIKVRHFQADPRASLYVSTPDFLRYAVAEGTAEISETATTPGDAVSRELLDMDGTVAAEDEAVFLENMVADRRLVIRVHVDRLYGGGLGATSS
jgi:PPOX class probable F420-dependent enzyme